MYRKSYALSMRGGPFVYYGIGGDKVKTKFVKGFSYIREDYPSLPYALSSHVYI